MKKLVFLLFTMVLLTACTPAELLIDFDTNGGSDIESVIVLEGETLTEPEQPTREGYDFDGWYVDEDFEVVYDYTNIVEDEFILYAKWDALSYEITYHNEHLETDVVEQYDYTDTITLIEPVVIGYDFIGWYTDETLETLYTGTFMPNNDLDLYGKFNVQTYTITLNDTLEDTVTTIDFDYGEEVNLSELYEWGYTFNGWFIDALLETMFTETTMPAMDIELFTYWQVKLCGEGQILNDDNFCITEVDDIVGQIDIAVWGGSGVYYEDFGKLNLTKYDLVSQVEAAYYSVAKLYNESHPNVTINFIAYQGGPNDGGASWDQKLYTHSQNFGTYPSLFMSNDLVGDVTRGTVADLSQFSEDPRYQTLNPSIMSMMNYYGFQAGLPSYILPWGVYVNKELADDNDIDVPDPNWTIDEYTTFAANQEANVFYGAMDTPISFLETGTTTVHQMLFNYTGGDVYVDLNSDEVRDLIPYLSTWSENTVWGNNPSSGFMDESWWWSYKFFADNKLLTLAGDPWMMGDCAVSDPSYSLGCDSTDWDIYPRPSTDYQPNTVGIVLDPMAVYNQCLNDGNLACAEEEITAIEVSYDFAMFMITDTGAWQARASQEFVDLSSGVSSSALGDSFPVTTGQLFEDQMNIWYSVPKHQRFDDATSMPGFQEVLSIYENGQFWDVSDKVYPYHHISAGYKNYNLYEWKNYWDSTVNGGVTVGEATYTTTILNNLSTWNVNSNLHFGEAFNDLQYALMMYYGFDSSDFDDD